MTQSLPPLRIGIAGLGTVGAAVVKTIQTLEDTLTRRSGRPIKVVAVTARDPSKDRGIDLSGIRWVDSPQKLAADPEVDCFIELMGGEHPAKGCIIIALESGKSVVTANKAVMATHGLALADMAEENGCALRFEAAVAGAIPIISGVRTGLAGSHVTSIRGILNGTCHFILTEMVRTGRDFQDVLAEAQAKGYAEADPSFDIDGIDAGHKLVLLASLALNVQTDVTSLHAEGIRQITQQDLQLADSWGYSIALLAQAKLQQTDSGQDSGTQGLCLWVYPALLPKSDFLSRITGVTNAVVCKTHYGAELSWTGPGAGGMATASAVLSDVVAIARGEAATIPFAEPAETLQKLAALPLLERHGKYYLRLEVSDRPGVFATIATTFTKHGASISEVVQRPLKDGVSGKQAIIAMLLHTCPETSMNAVCEDLKAQKDIIQDLVMLRVESD